MHILVKLLWVPSIVLLTSYLPIFYKLLSYVFIVFWAGLLANHRFHMLVAKLKVIFLSLFILYAVTTPGRYLFDNDAFFNVVTHEGVLFASLQILHLLAVLGLIALILQSTKRSALMGGFYCLIKPFSESFAKRFVARLSLVLLAVESQNNQRKQMKDIIQLLTSQYAFSSNMNYIHIELHPLTKFDFLMIASIACIILMTLFKFS